MPRAAGSRERISSWPRAFRRTGWSLIAVRLVAMALALRCLFPPVANASVADLAPAYASLPAEQSLAASSFAAPDVLPVRKHARIPAPPPGYNTYEGGWLHLAFAPEKRQRVQPLIEDSDAFRERLRELFGHPVLERVTVYVASTASEMSSLAPSGGASVPRYADGVTYPELGFVLLTIEPRQHGANHDLLEVFRHELAHQALRDALSGAHVPRWLHEGFAVHQSGESPLARMQSLWTATLAETLIPLVELDRSFPDDSVLTPLAYSQSADVVRYLLRTRYSERFMSMLNRVRGGQPFERAMSDAYGFDVYGVGASSLEDEWRRDVAKRYSFWPVLFSGSMVWLGAVGLFVVGYYRKRKQQRATLERWAVEEEAAEQAAGEEAQAAGRMHIVIAPRQRPTEPPAAEMDRVTREVEVPKVEHDGSWHTLH